MFSGRPPLVYDVPLCFCCLLYVKLARAFLALGLFWALSRQVFLFFSVSWTNLLVFGGPALLLFLHRGSARAHICASWRRQTTNSEANGVTKSIFVPPRGSLFGPLFGTFSYFSEFCDFVKIELPCRRELGFEGPGRSKCHFFFLLSPSQKFERSRRLMTRGVGGPPRKT